MNLFPRIIFSIPIALLSACVGNGISPFGVSPDERQFNAALSQFQACDDQIQNQSGMDVLNVRSPERISSMSQANYNDPSYPDGQNRQAMRTYLAIGRNCDRAFDSVAGSPSMGGFVVAIRTSRDRFWSVGQNFADGRMTWGQFNRARAEMDRIHHAEIEAAKRTSIDGLRSSCRDWMQQNAAPGYVQDCIGNGYRALPAPNGYGAPAVNQGYVGSTLPNSGQGYVGSTLPNSGQGYVGSTLPNSGQGYVGSTLPNSGQGYVGSPRVK